MRLPAEISVNMPSVDSMTRIGNSNLLMPCPRRNGIDITSVQMEPISASVFMKWPNASSTKAPSNEALGARWLNTTASSTTPRIRMATS